MENNFEEYSEINSFNNEESKKISEIEPLQESRNSIVKMREQLKEFIEPPLLSACETLYDKNIRTLSTLANKQDIERQTGHIIVDFDSLSDKNKELGKQFGEIVFDDGINQLVIKIPITENSTFEEIKNYAESLVGKFEKQSMTWVPFYTIEQLRKIYGVEPNDDSFGIEGFADQFYYDPSKNLFYMSEEHARKANEKIE